MHGEQASQKEREKSDPQCALNVRGAKNPNRASQEG